MFFFAESNVTPIRGDLGNLDFSIWNNHAFGDDKKPGGVHPFIEPNPRILTHLRCFASSCTTTPRKVCAHGAKVRQADVFGHSRCCLQVATWVSIQKMGTSKPWYHVWWFVGNFPGFGWRIHFPDFGNCMLFVANDWMTPMMLIRHKTGVALRATTSGCCLALSASSHSMAERWYAPCGPYRSASRLLTVKTAWLIRWCVHHPTGP